MPGIVSGSEYLIYWIGLGVCIIIGLIAGVVSMFRNRNKSD
jgi:hypothetical protein